MISNRITRSKSGLVIGNKIITNKVIIQVPKYNFFKYFCKYGKKRNETVIAWTAIYMDWQLSKIKDIILALGADLFSSGK